MTFPEDGARLGEVYQNVHETRLRGQVRQHVRQRLIFGKGPLERIIKAPIAPIGRRAWVAGPRGQRQDGILCTCQPGKIQRVKVYAFHQDLGQAVAAAITGEPHTFENSHHIDCVSGRLWGRIPTQGEIPLEGRPALDCSTANGDVADDEDVAYAT
jgi:hypothetical protein